MERVLVQKTAKIAGQKARVAGWVNSRRDHGGIVFLDLRDRSGILQVVADPKLAEGIKEEYVLEAEGTVQKRPGKMTNPSLETGAVELKAETIKVLSAAKTLPISIEGSGYEISEEKRLKYRYLDLRRPRLQKNLKTRHYLLQFIRDFLSQEGFIEVETPILTKSTPEGARDFLVPSRLQPGRFYALPQSPQQYKQMLMVSGVEKYFQIARALRDEDPRADRQAEHTQLDVEMAFVQENDILALVEKLYIALVKKLFPEKRIQQIPFPRISYQTALKKYKTDKPDLRKNKEGKEELAFAFIVDFPMFEWHVKDKKWGAMHHPFTKPKTNDKKAIKNIPEKITAHQYDFVLNGFEIGGGSIRTTDLEIMTAVFELLGHKKAEVKKNFPHYFEAFSCGVPPHGGIALGIDRILAVLLGEPSIREVIAFPKTGDNRDLMMDVPSLVEEKQLKELHLKIDKRK